MRVTREEQKLLTRAKIMDTAFSLYCTDGFAVPTKLIAEAAGISHGSIFVHFPTKEALQQHVLERFAKEVGEKLHRLSKDNHDISELLFAHISVLKDYEKFYIRLVK